MEREMRVFGLTLPELFLADMLTIVGWVLIVLGIATRVFTGFFQTLSFGGGVAMVLTVVTGLALIVASAGIRQNRAALDLGVALFAAMEISWLVHAFVRDNWPAGILAVLLAPVLVVILYLRDLGIQARFKPRFFSLRQFEVVIQVADTMIDSDGEAALHPIQVAVNIDHFMSKFQSDTAQDIRQNLFFVEWLLPLITLGRPFPFSSLGSHERRRAVEKVIGAKLPILKDVARFLKLLANAGYYGSAEGMAQVGYRHYDERERSVGADQTPSHHSEPQIYNLAGK